jgi:hypothetical protein
MGHLIDSASNNHQRFVRAALQGTVEWPSYDQNGWVRIQAYAEAPWALLLDTWPALNRLLAHLLSHLPEAAAGALCRIGDEGPMTLDELARAYLDHLRHHLAQIGAWPARPAG